jgi:hypothetical protein
MRYGADEELRPRRDGHRAHALVAELIASLSADDIVHAIAESTRLSPAARAKALALIQEWRRTERLDRTGRASSSPQPPASPPASRPGRGMRS